MKTMKQEIKTETVVIELPLVMIGEKDLCMAKSWPEQPGFYIGKNPIGEYCICEKQEGVDTVNFSWLPIQFVEVINRSIAEASERAAFVLVENCRLNCIIVQR